MNMGCDSLVYVPFSLIIPHPERRNRTETSSRPTSEVLFHVKDQERHESEGKQTSG